MAVIYKINYYLQLLKVIKAAYIVQHFLVKNRLIYVVTKHQLMKITTKPLFIFYFY